MRLSENHWTLEIFRERITLKNWRKVLLNKDDQIFVAGRSRQLVAKRLGAGIVEVSKKPIKA